jgi:threonyl-tRNA synthetase
VRVITLNDDEALIMINYAKPILAELRANMVRVDADFSATPFNSDESRAGAKISNAEQLRVHTMLVTRLRCATARQASAVATWTPAR